MSRRSQGNWVEELPSVLCSYWATPRKGTGESPFHLCFGIEALILVEIGSPSKLNIKFNAIKYERLLQEDLLFRENTWDAAAWRDETYKRAVAQYHNACVRPSGI